MDRIIISEIDNTSNIESLSSFDVVYVPGFANNGGYDSTGKTKLYRNPTLCTTKYEFLKEFGEDCPTFPKDQPYPIADENKWGFPYYAIPNYVPADTPKLIERLNNFTYKATTGEQRKDIVNAVVDTTATANHYTYEDSTVEGWVPTEGVIYYVATLTDNNISMHYFDTEDHTSGYDEYVLFSCGDSPVYEGWYELIGDEFVHSSDETVEFDSNNIVKPYYGTNTNDMAMMFRGPTSTTAGDADPGYRYALYLLSLGIPIYYEQMNTPYEKVNKNDTTMWRHSEDGTVNPYLNEWCIRTGENSYVRTTDTVILDDVDYYVGADISIDSMYRGLIARFNDGDTTAASPADYSFDSIGDYAVKYLTSGGYPTFEYGPLIDMDTRAVGSSPLAESMIMLAKARQDAVALIDHTNNPNRTIYATDIYSVVRRVREDFALEPEIGSFGAMFTPWYTCTHAVVAGENYNYAAQMPASLAFLSALSTQVKNYNPWLAVSGVTRGKVPYCGGLHTNYKLTNNVADSYQIVPDSQTQLENAAISINPITYIRNYDYCIWGNRTLRDNTTGTKATSFLNVRDSVSDIKKQLYEASRNLLFEQNTSLLWINFKGLITPLLDRMVGNSILSDYSITKYNVDPETGLPVPAYKVLAVIRIVPINSVEVFELQVQLENSNVAITEVE